MAVGLFGIGTNIDGSMKMLDLETRNMLKALSDIINDNIDRLIVDRDHATLKKDYRYVIRKLEHALGQVHLAGERANDE